MALVVKSPDLRVAQEEGLAIDHLSKDAADAPDVYRCGIKMRPQQDLRCPIQERHNLHRYVPQSSNQHGR